MTEITLTLTDGKELKVAKGSSAIEAVEKIGPRLAKDAIAVKLDGEKKDLACKIEHDAKFEVITYSTKEGQDIFWHSTAHVMAEAIMKLFPGTLPTIGPPIDFGFYYDFDKKQPFAQADLEKIEKKMQEIIAGDIPFVRKEYAPDEAKKLFTTEKYHNKYKVQLIDEKSEGAEGSK